MRTLVAAVTALLIPAAAASQAPHVRTVEDRAHVTVMEFGGVYDRQPEGNRAYEVAVRQAVAREFLRTHTDDYDFLVIFSRFNFDLGSDTAGSPVEGLYTAIRNDVTGIGIEPFDQSAAYGSSGRLQGYIDMGVLSRLAQDPTDPRFERTLSVLAHEMMHRWGARVRFRDTNGTVSEALLGRDNAHWNFLLQTHNSVHYGHDWRDNGGGTFTSVGRSSTFYSPLDLYLMGMLDRTQVPPFFVIENPQILPTRLPEVGVTVTGTKKWITIDQVIAAEGERVPSAAQAPKRFKMGFVFLVRPGEQADGGELASINTIREAFSTRAIILTNGKGVVQVYPEQPGAAPELPVPIPPSSGPRSGPTDLVQAVDWLLSRQAVNGSWADSPSTRVRDTSAVLGLLAEMPVAFSSHQRGLGWLTLLDEHLNVDMVSRRLLAIKPQFSATDASFLNGARNASGGWGLRQGYLSDPLDTALALLSRPGNGDISADLAYLVAAQNPDGGWPTRPGGPSAIQGTLAVLRLAERYSGNASLADSLARGLVWLKARQYGDGGFGDGVSTVYETAEAVLDLLHTDFPKPQLASALEYLRSRQLADGSWGGSTYQTALATRALKVADLPNARPGALSFSPTSPVEGQIVTISSVVINDGVLDIQNVRVSLFAGDPAAGGTQIGADVVLPSLPALTQLPVTFTWNTDGAAGARALVLVVDRLGELIEFNEADNAVSATLVVREPPLEADLSIEQAEIAFLPALLQALPQDQVVTARISNVGRTAVPSVTVWLWEGEPATGRKVAETAIAVGPRSSATATFAFRVTATGDQRYTVVVDPQGAVNEADEANNQAFKTLLVQGTLDFLVVPGSLLLSENPTAPGRDLVISAQVANQGTTDAFNVPVRIFVNDPAGVIDIATRTVDLPAGGSMPISVTWRTSRALSGVPLVVHVDPAGTFSESAEANNTLSVALTVMSSTDPNLRVSHDQLQVALPVHQGGASTITGTVLNNGGGPATNVAVAFFLGVPGSGGVQLGATQVLPELAAGAAIAVMAPWGPIADAGDKLIYLVVDPDNTIAEFDETDNRAFVAVRVLSRPDLMVAPAALSFAPVFPRQGDTVTVTAVIVNAGEQSATAAVRFFDGPPAASNQLGADRAVTVTALGQTSVQLSFEATSSAARTIYVVVDPLNEVAEQDEANNTAFRTIGVQDASLWFSNLYFSPNNDQRQDGTELFYRFETPQQVARIVVFDRRAHPVRTLPADPAAVLSGTAAWDGRNDQGLVVADGPYDVTILSASDAILATARVVVDTNNLSIGDAVGSKFFLQTNLTCGVPSFKGDGYVIGPAKIGWLPDDSGMVSVFAIAAIQQTTGLQYVDFPVGVYVTSPDGESTTRITPDSWTTRPPSSNGTHIFRTEISPDGEKILIGLQKYTHGSFQPQYVGPVEFWVVNADGSGLRKIAESPADVNIDGPYFYWVQTKWSTRSDEVAIEHRFEGARRSRIYIAKADGSGQSLVREFSLSQSFYDFGWSPDGARFLYSFAEPFPATGYLYRLYASQRDGSSPQVIAASATDAFTDISALNWIGNDQFIHVGNETLHPNGYLNWGSSAINVYRLNLAGDRPVVIPGLAVDSRKPVRSPDGTRLAMSGRGASGATRIYALGADGVPEVVHSGTQPSEGTVALHWLADGQGLAWVDQLIVTMKTCSEGGETYECNETVTAVGSADLRDGSRRVFPAGEVGEYSSPIGPLPDGNAFLYSNSEGELWALSLADGTRTRLLPHERSSFQAASFSPTGKYFLYQSARDSQDATSACFNGSFNYQEFAMSSLLNLTAQFGFRRDRAQLAVRGTAEDANFLGYRLEYAPVTDPTAWAPIGTASDIAVVNGLLADWVPPSEGSFHVRLTAEDKAGNVRTTRRRITWALTPSITNLSMAPRLFSPNGDGTRDTVTIDYLVLGPVNLSFAIANSAGVVVRTITQSHTAMGPASVAWDGRIDGGEFAADGDYSIKVLDYEFFVTVDTTPPVTTLALGSGFHVIDRRLACLNQSIAESCLVIDGPMVDTPYFLLQGRAEDTRIARWLLESGTGTNPAEWHFVAEGTENLAPDTRPLARFTAMDDVVSKRYRLTAFDQAGNRASVVSDLAPAELILHEFSGPVLTTRPQAVRLGLNTLSVVHTSRVPMQWMTVQYRLKGTMTWATGAVVPSPGAAAALAWDSSTLTGGLIYDVRVVGTDTNGALLASNPATMLAEEFRFIEFHTGLKAARGLITLAEPIVNVTLVVETDASVGSHSTWGPGAREFLIGVAPNPALEPCAFETLSARFRALGASGKVYYSNTANVKRSAPPSMVSCGGDPAFPGKLELKLTIEPEMAPACGLAAPGAVGIMVVEKEFALGRSRLFIQDVPNGPMRELTGTSARILTAGLPEGRYAVRATAEIPGEVEATATGFFVVDRVAPVAQLTYPATNQQLCPVKVGTRLVVPIEGIAEDANFRSFHVDYGLGDNPQNWVPVPVGQGQAAGTSPARGVLANWDVTDLAGGTYTLRLRVYDHGGNLTCSTVSFRIPGAGKVRDLRADLRLVSPNADAVSDSTTLSYELDEPSTLTARVYATVNGVRAASATRTIFTSATQLAGTNSFIWDGRADGGIPAPDGQYEVVIGGADSCGNATEASLIVTVDTTPPDVVIASPQAGAVTSLLTAVRGTATDLHFQEFRLFVTDGSSPGPGRLLASGLAPVQNDLLGTWDTGGTAGSYVLRLTATDRAGNSREALVPITLSETAGLVTSLAAEPSLFSPNRDGRLDSSAVEYKIGADSRIRLQVLDSTDTVVKLLSESDAMAGAAYSFAWDGTGTAGSVVPDGTYYIRLEATAKADGTRTQTERRTSIVDTTAPALAAVLPADGAHVRGTFAITGTASDLHIDRYTVTYATGAAAPVVVDSGRQSRTDYQFGQASDVPDGLYSLRLEAADLAGNVTERTIPFTIDNTAPSVALTAPVNGSFAGSGTIQVLGTAQDAHLVEWSLRLGEGTAPAAWTVIANGVASPSAGLPLTTVNTASLSDGDYVVSLTATDKAGSTAEARHSFVVDRTPPVARLTQPEDLSRIYGPSPILGEATDANFKSAVLEFSEGPASSAFRFATLARFQSPVANGPLFQWTALPPNGTYTLRLIVEDRAGLRSEVRSTVTIDTEPPTVPSNLTATLNNRRDAHLTWSPSTGTELAGYHVYRSGVRITTSVVPGPSFVDVGLAEGRHTYVVRAFAESDLVSAPSNEAEVRVDLTGPSARIHAPLDGAAVSGLFDIRGTAASDDLKTYRVLVGAGGPPTAFTVIRTSSAGVTADVLAEHNAGSLAQGSILTIRLEAEDLLGNMSSHQVAVTTDNVAPSAPVLSAATPTGSDITVQWQPNSEADLAGVLLYNVDVLANARRIVNGSLTPFLLQGTTFIDRALPDGEHKYYAFALDKAGNQSPQSNTLTVVLETRAPRATIVQPANNSTTEHAVSILATTPDRDVASVQFQVRPISGDWSNVGTAATREPYQAIWDPAGLDHGSYQLRAVATDASGNTDPAPPIITIVLRDLTAPAAPSALTARVAGENVALTWAAVTADDLAGYRVYRQTGTQPATAVNSAPVTETTLENAVVDGQYVYTVRAVDAIGNESDASPAAPAYVYAPVLAVPAVCVAGPTTLVTGSAAPGSVVTVFFDPGTGPVPVGTAVAASDGTFEFSAVSLVAGPNAFTALASDAAGNTSRRSEALLLTRSDPAAAPAAFVAAVNGFDVALSWTADPAIASYSLTRNGVSLNPLTPAFGSANASSQAAGWAQAQFAHDRNESTYWFPASWDSEPWWQLQLFEPALVSKIEIDWSGEYDPAAAFDVERWDGTEWVPVASVRDNESYDTVITLATPSLTAKIRIYVPARDDQETAIEEVRVIAWTPVTGSTFADNSLADGRYTYRLFALNACGVPGSPAEAVAAVGDVLAPQAPSGLSASAALSDVALTWSTVNDPGLAGYNAYRRVGGEWVKLNAAIIPGSTWVDAGVPNGTQVYRVTAVDAVGNESDPSNEAQAFVDVPVPAAPAGLTVSAPPQGGVLDVSWQSLPGVAGYRLFRSLTAGGPYQPLGGALTATSYRDGAVVNGTTYYYIVRGADAVPNLGAASNEASGTPVDTLAPARPVLLAPTVAGVPLAIAGAFTPISGRAEPGSIVTLLNEGLALAQAPASEQATAETITVENPNSLASFYRADHLVAMFTSGPPNWYAKLTLMDVATGTRRNFDSVRDGSEPLFSPDGRTIAFSNGQAIKFFDRATEQVTRTITLPHYPSGLAYSPDGTQMAYATSASPNYELWVIDLATQARRRLHQGGYVALQTWSPAGDRIAVGIYSSNFTSFRIQLLDAATGTPTTVDPAGVGYPFSFSPDGGRLVFTSARNGLEELWVYDIAAGTAAPLGGESVLGNSAQYSPDGEKVAYFGTQGDLQLRMRTIATDEDVQLLATVPNGRVHWTRDASVVVLAYGQVIYVRAPGAFTFDNVFLPAQQNFYSAIAEDAGGNVSAPADPIELRRDAQRLPDLVTSDASFTRYPRFPLVGEPVRLSATIRNDSDVASGKFGLIFYTVDGTGRLVSIGTPRFVASLAAHAETVLSIDWPTTAAGPQTVVVRVDPDGAVPEISDYNNEARATVLVTADGSPLVTAATDRSSYASGQPVTVTATVANPGAAADFVFELRIEDASGYRVTTLVTQDLAGFGQASRDFTGVWTPGSTVPGAYRARAVLRRAQGGEQFTDAPFALLGTRQALAKLTTDRASYQVGETVRLSALVRNASTTEDLQSLGVIIRVADAGGAEVFRTDGRVDRLFTGAQAQVPAEWIAPGPGSYNASLSVLADGVELAQSSIAFAVSGVAQVQGRVSTTPAPVGFGEAFAIVAEVTNTGTAPVIGATLRLRLVHPETQATLGSFERPLDLLPGGSQPWQIAASSAGLQLRSYNVLLQLDQNGSLRSLASGSLSIVDSRAPTVIVSSPAPASLFNADVTFTAVVADDASGVDRVEFRVNAGPWTRMAVEDAAAGRYTARLPVGPTAAEGPQVVTVRAFDRSGNGDHTSSTDPNPASAGFVIDVTPPVITVAGVAHGQTYPTAVTPVITVSDTHAATFEARLNAAPFTSGTAVSAAGLYVLSIDARDAAGNTAGRIVQFTVGDGQEPPVAHAGADQTVDEGAAVTLDGSASGDPQNRPLTYTWRQISGPSVVLNTSTPARPSFVAPAVPRAGDTAIFELVVHNGLAASAPATVGVAVRNVNRPPVADAAAVSTPEDTAVQITLSGSDPDDDAGMLTFIVTIAPVHGQLTGTGATLTYTPAPDYHGPDTFAFVVSDGLDQSPAATVSVTVSPVNDAPVAHAADDQSIDEGQRVTLNGSGSTDVDGDALIYQWTQIAGRPVTLDETDPARPSFVAPDVPRDGETLTFQLTVRDGRTASAPATVNVRVKDLNRAPVADAGPAQQVRQETVVTLDGRASYDPDGDALTFSWRQVTGPTVQLSSTTSSQPSFTAPIASPAGVTLVFELAVSDGLLVHTARTTITVEHVNHVPVANAGPDASHEEGSVVTLNGTGSTDADGDPLTYRWEQVSGLAVVLSDPAAATPTFTAPLAVIGGTQLVFRLVVNDGSVDSAPDLVTIAIRNVVDAPTCSAAQPSSAILWPPNHQLVPISILGVSTSTSTPVQIRILGVTQDERTDTTGDGTTAPDAFIQGATVLLRAERAQDGDGRVYRVSFSATDAFGGACAGAVTVGVPNSQGKKSSMVDSGQIYDATRRN